MKSLFTLVALSAVVGLLTLAPASLGQGVDPTVDVYGGAPGGMQTQVGGVNASAPARGEVPSSQHAVAGVSATSPGASPGHGAAGPGAQAAGSSAETAGKRLAFTGLDLGLVLGAGVVLLLVGTTVRWVTRRTDTPTP